MIRQLFDQDTWTYTYIVADDTTGEAAIIDAVREKFERDVKLIRDLGLTLKYALETHVHADHITSAGALRDEFGAKVALHQSSESTCADVLLKDGDVLHVGNLAITALHTPGHTNADTSYLIDGAVFTGDALLIGGCGRTDFQAGDAGQLFDSITGKLFTLPESTVVYPGHDYRGLTTSTIGEEKAHNARLGNGKSKSEFIEIMNQLNLPNPARIDVAVPGNMACGNV
jgi:sulfur dioxygenase